jgi:hypothetical protein
MKQTAVDWLADNLIGNPFSDKDFEHNRNVFKKAKQIEKEQMLEVSKEGIFSTHEFEQYYKETYE